MLGFLFSLEKMWHLERLASLCCEYPQRFFTVTKVTKRDSDVRVEAFGRFLVIYRAWGSISPVSTPAVTWQCDIKAGVTWGRGEDGG